MTFRADKARNEHLAITDGAKRLAGRGATARRGWRGAGRRREDVGGALGRRGREA